VQPLLHLERLGGSAGAERADEDVHREIRPGIARAEWRVRVADHRREQVRVDGDEDGDVAARVVELAPVERMARVEDDVIRRRERAARAALVDVDAGLRKDDVRPRPDVVVHLVPERMHRRAAKLADLERPTLEQQARGRGCRHRAQCCTS
jgi:hypothetical protein